MGNVTSCSAVDVSRNSLVTIIATADWHQVDLDMAQPTSLSLGKLTIDVSMLDLTLTSLTHFTLNTTKKIFRNGDTYIRVHLKSKLKDSRV